MHSLLADGDRSAFTALGEVALDDEWSSAEVFELGAWLLAWLLVSG